MKILASLFVVTGALAATVHADTIKVDLNSNDGRKDVLTPHWSNWAWHEGHSGSQKFGDVTVTFRAASNDILSPILYKGLIDYGATMAADGVVAKGGAKDGVEMVISGLTPGKHTVVTYHNELHDVEPASFNVSVDGATQLKNFLPTNRATNDYDVASAFLELEAYAGKDVVIKFVPNKSGSNPNFIINGFEIDSVNPRWKAIKP